MNTIKAISRLIRLPNLVIIILTLVLMRYCVLLPILVVNGLSLEMNNFLFYLLVLAVTLIAAGGYIINDIEDVDTDTLNKPNRVIIGNVVSASAANTAYYIINVLAFGAAFYVSYKAHMFSLFIVFPIAAGTLWFYSNTYKRQFLLGNIIISLLTAVIPLLPAFFEIPFIIAKYRSYLVSEGLNVKYLYDWTGVFALFAFTGNLIREIVKDAEDFTGDAVTGCVTLPIYLGIKTTRVIINILSFLLIIMIAAVFIFFLLFNASGKVDYVTLFYFLILLIVPLIYVIVLTIRKTNNTSFTRASLALKLVITFGVLYAMVLRFKIL